MPKRSNDFQRLVALIQAAVEPLGATVTESAMVPGHRNKVFREIDVLVHRPGEGGFRIAVEAKDEKRKLDVTKVESYIGKYRSKSGIKMDKVTLVAQRGFTKEAADRAQEENIQTVTLKKAFHVNWPAKIPRRLVSTSPPQVSGYGFFPNLGLDPIPRAAIREGHVYCRTCKTDHGTPFDFGIRTLNHSPTITKLKLKARRLGMKATEVARFPFRHNCDMVLRYLGSDYPFKELQIVLSYLDTEGELRGTSYTYGAQPVQHLSGQIAGDNIEFVVLDGNTQGNIPVRLNGQLMNSQSPSSPNLAPLKRTGLLPGHRVVVDLAASAIGRELLFVELPGKLRLTPNASELSLDCVERFKNIAAPIAVLSHEWATDGDDRIFVRELNELLAREKVVATIVISDRLPGDAIVRQALDYGIHATTPLLASNTDWLKLLTPVVYVCTTGVFFEDVIFSNNPSSESAAVDRSATVSLSGEQRSVEKILSELDAGLTDYFLDVIALKMAGGLSAVQYSVDFISKLPANTLLNRSAGADAIDHVRGRARVRAWMAALRDSEAAKFLMSGKVPLSKLNENSCEQYEGTVDLNVFRQPTTPILQGPRSGIPVRDPEKFEGSWKTKVTWLPAHLKKVIDRSGA